MTIPEYVMEAFLGQTRELVELMVQDPSNVCATTTLRGPDGVELTLFLADSGTAQEFFEFLSNHLPKSAMSNHEIPRPN